MSRSFGAGSFGYGPDIYEQSKSDFDVDARRALDGLGPAKPQLTAEQVKQAYEEAVREEQAHRDRLENRKNGDAFIAGHPEFVDNDANAQLLLNQMNTMFGEGLHPVHHFEQAYEYLRTKTNFLKIDKTVLASQEKQAARQRYEAEKAHVTATAFDPNADYSSLSLEQLKERAIEEHQRQLQAAGERGGNGW